MIQLSPAQEAVVKAPISNALQVLASAGSGKTRVLTERIRFILDQTRKDRVLALTFTNKAAEEMQERLADVDEIDDRSWISTIHSIAQRILEQYGHTIGLPAELHIYERDNDRMEVFLQSLRDDGVDIDEYLNVTDTLEKKNRQTVMQNYMNLFSLIKREMLIQNDIEDDPQYGVRAWKIFQDYQAALLNSGGIDYDDILIKAHQILLTQDWVGDLYRTKYKHLCVDEAQDLNKAQYEFVRAFCGETIKSVLMVGDPNQMIYGFNGSSSDYLCKHFLADFQPTSFFLNENYRSSKAVINIANQIKPNSQQFNEMTFDGVAEVIPSPTEETEAAWIINQINSLLELKSHPEIEGEISLENMVVIGRNRFVFTVLKSLLEEQNIPHFMKKGERQSEPVSLFGKVLDFSIRLKLNPKDWVGGKKLSSLLKVDAPESWGERNLLAQWSQDVKKSSVVFSDLQSNLLLAVNDLDADSPNIRKFCTQLENQLKQLVDMDVDNEKHRQELEISLKELEEFQENWTRFRSKGIGDTLQAFRNALSLGQLTESFDGKGLALSTVHTMKGLEKDIVFLAGMCEGVFPDYRAKTASEIEEERNSAFVAVTRARRWLYITYPQQRKMPWGDVKFQKPSRFLLNLKTGF